MSKLFFSALFFTIIGSFNNVWGFNQPNLGFNMTVDTVICDAPPADSFRVTGRGPDFVSLAWHPATGVTSHTLVAQIRLNPTSTWISIDTLYNVVGASAVVTGIGFDKDCRFLLYSNCRPNMPGVVPAELFCDKIVLDLTVSGRTPENPRAVN